MKKLLLSFLMLIAAVPLWAEEFVADGIIYSIIPNTNEVEVVGGYYNLLPKQDRVTIPEYLFFKGTRYYTRSICKRAFKGMPIEYVCIEQTVRSIGEEAFWETNVAIVSFGRDGLSVNPPEEIGKNAFPPGVDFAVHYNTGQFKEVFASGSYTVINHSRDLYRVFYGATDGNRKAGVCAYEEIKMKDYYDWWMHLRSSWLIPELSDSLDYIQCIYPAEWENNMLLAYMDSIVNSDGRTMLFPRQNPFINSITNPTGITGIFVDRYTDKVSTDSNDDYNYEELPVVDYVNVMYDPKRSQDRYNNIIPHLLSTVERDLTFEPVFDDPKIITLGLGETKEIDFWIKPVFLNVEEYGYRSSDSEIFTVDTWEDNKVKITGRSVGTATLTAGANAAITRMRTLYLKNNINVVVRTPIQHVTSISLSLDGSGLNDLYKGETAKITYKITGNGSSYCNSLLWSSSNPEVATVDAYGVVTALKVGKTTITAFSKDGWVTESIDIGVYNDELYAFGGFNGWDQRIIIDDKAIKLTTNDGVIYELNDITFSDDLTFQIACQIRNVAKLDNNRTIALTEDNELYYSRYNIEFKPNSFLSVPWSGTWSFTIDLEKMTIQPRCSTPMPDAEIYAVGDFQNWDYGKPFKFEKISSNSYRLSDVQFTEDNLQFAISTKQGTKEQFERGLWGESSGTLEKDKYIALADTIFGNLSVPYAGVWTFDISYSGTMLNGTALKIKATTDDTPPPAPLYIVGAFQNWDYENAVKMNYSDGKYFITGIEVKENDKNIRISYNKGSLDSFNAGSIGPSEGYVTINWEGDCLSLWSVENIKLPYTGIWDIEINLDLEIWSMLRSTESMYAVYESQGWDYSNPSRFTNDGDFLVLPNVDFCNDTEFKLARDFDCIEQDYGLQVGGSYPTLGSGSNQLYDIPGSSFSYGNFVPFKGIWTLIIDKKELTIRAILIEEAKEPDPYETTIYLLGHVNGNNWDPAKGVLMDYLGDGLYSTVATVDDCGNGLGYFAFSDRIGSWDDVNSGIRYGADTPDLFIDSSWGAAVYNNSNSWATTPGVYRIDFTLPGMWMSISEESGIGDVESPNIKITRDGCDIVINNAPLNSLVQIYNAGGQMVSMTEVRESKTIINMQIKGFYIVKVNDTMKKIIIK